ncbi:AAA-ATPase [Sesamum alatum]|uniref:AAA-ATPase n=1 Tax=Sesamum alatum TaxID=300844 RepID=A0AAE2CCT4_9LAMI|nr:AAA-ATPase [Sesamum alatum]
MWSHVIFEHPATFDTLAMDPGKKQEIIDDLINFTKSKDYYAKIGRAWKRGYLLYGPPGTGKSTMIAAMANLLKYDVYDLELTAVTDNTQLRKLLVDTASKSIVVIEDIDCSLDLTGGGRRKRTRRKRKMVRRNMKRWMRIIVFTTNYVEKLDPALIRRGRMDKHIELFYCGFEAFKVLAKNYLDIDSHELFATVRKQLEETKMTPADVAENVMPKLGSDDEGTCLRRLMKALEEAKEEERQKAKEEEKEEEEEERKRKETENGGDDASIRK